MLDLATILLPLNLTKGATAPFWRQKGQGGILGVTMEAGVDAQSATHPRQCTTKSGSRGCKQWFNEDQFIHNTNHFSIKNLCKACAKTSLSLMHQSSLTSE